MGGGVERNIAGGVTVTEPDSARMKSAHEPNRSSGCLASAFKIALLAAIGKLGMCSAGGRGMSRTWLIRIDMRLTPSPAVNGGSPHSIS
jgi:hypothetical protein